MEGSAWVKVVSFCGFTLSVAVRGQEGGQRRQQLLGNQFSGQPWTSSSGGPSPPMTACWRSPPASTYRLVNVSVNPAGRFGAPETERGPSGWVAGWKTSS
jgi:hypothetical protein